MQRLGGIIVLLLAAVLLLLGLRMGVEAEEGSRQETAATPAAQSTAVSAPSASDAIAIPLDVTKEAIPVLSDNALAPAPVPVTFQGKRPHHEFETYTVHARRHPLRASLINMASRPRRCSVATPSSARNQA